MNEPSQAFWKVELKEGWILWGAKSSWGEVNQIWLDFFFIQVEIWNKNKKQVWAQSYQQKILRILKISSDFQDVFLSKYSGENLQKSV